MNHNIEIYIAPLTNLYCRVLPTQAKRKKQTSAVFETENRQNKTQIKLNSTQHLNSRFSCTTHIYHRKKPSFVTVRANGTVKSMRTEDRRAQQSAQEDGG